MSSLLPEMCLSSTVWLDKFKLYILTINLLLSFIH